MRSRDVGGWLSSTVGSQRLGARLAAIAAIAGGGALSAAGCAEGDRSEGPIAEASQALLQCTIIQRGGAGAVEDTYIKSDNQGSNFGANKSLATGGAREALVRFDISAVPPGSLVHEGTMRLHGVVATGQTVRAHRATAAWSEATATYASFAQAFSPAVEASFVSASGAVSVDLSDLVQTWVNGTYANHGVLLEETSATSSLFMSSENPAQYQPYLKVCWSSCPSGFANCDGDPDNGCEASLATTTDCGGCGVACAPANATGACTAGTCQIGACAPGYVDANDDPSDGCETLGCADGVQDQDETGVDCGGSMCGPCALGEGCVSDADCASGACFGGACACGGTHLVISEIKSRGAFGGQDEYIELYNPTSVAVTLDATWKIQGRAHNNIGYTTRWTGSGGVIPPHGHFLIAGDTYTLGPAADNALTVGITDAASMVLEHNGSPVDAVCYAFNATTLAALQGAGFICEGTPFGANPHDNTTSTNHDVSIERNPGGASGNCGDTGDNASDFFVTQDNPQSSQSPPTL